MVFSVWYFVMLFLVAGIAASLVVFFKMDKKDKILVDEFVKKSQGQELVENNQVEEEAKAE